MNYDRPGFCAKCHCEIAEFNGSDTKGNMIITKLKGNADSADFIMSDGSKMKVALCLNCKNSLQPEDADYIMKSVISGWQQELSQLDWSDEKKKNYMDKYSKLTITDRHDLKWTPDEIKRLKAG